MRVLESVAFIIVFMIAHAGCTPTTKYAVYRPMTEVKSVENRPILKMAMKLTTSQAHANTTGLQG